MTPRLTRKERGKKRAPGSDGGVPAPGKTKHGAEKDEPVGESGGPFRGEPDASYIDHSEQERIRRAIKGLEITVRQFSLQNLLGDKPAAFPHPIREVGSWNAAKNMASKDKSDHGDNAEFNFRRGTASS